MKILKWRIPELRIPDYKTHYTYGNQDSGVLGKDKKMNQQTRNKLLNL